MRNHSQKLARTDFLLKMIIPTFIYSLFVSLAIILHYHSENSALASLGEPGRLLGLPVFLVSTVMFGVTAYPRVMKRVRDILGNQSEAAAEFKTNTLIAGLVFPVIGFGILIYLLCKRSKQIHNTRSNPATLRKLSHKKIKMKKSKSLNQKKVA